ncbi:MAG: hypothetical protein IJT38_06065 [Clostridia bacterium]|nr:hypothetical protein [Clostridia bacterium]
MNIIGKQKTLEYFKNAVANDTLHHFYILEGQKGVGKKTLAHHIARMIHCSGAAKPCGTCSACIKHMGGSHPDFAVVSENSDKGNISVDTIRRISEDIYVKPLLADKKIYLIDDSKPFGIEAQNAFLKILEEPPSYAVIFLSATNAKALLPTVLSRAVVMRVDPCTKYEILRYLKENFPDTENAGLIASLSGGIIGTAADMASGEEYFEARKALYDVMSKNGPELILGLEQYIAKNKENINRSINLLLSWIRDAVSLKNGGSAINYDYEAEIMRFATKCKALKLTAIADEAIDIAQRFKKGNNLSLWTINLLTKFN